MAPFHTLIHAQFQACVRQAPDHHAIEYGNERVSYTELDARSDALARRLKAQGVGPEVIVGVALDKSVELIVAWLAILKAGGAWLPIDSQAPQERVAAILAAAGSQLVLTRPQHQPLLPPGVRTILPADGLPEDPAQQAFAATVLPDNLSYVLFTSGSTGTPKGVMIEHQQALNTLQALSKEYRIGPGTRVLFFAQPTFDSSVAEVFTTLLVGGTLIIPTSAQARDLDKLQSLLRESRIHVVTLPPALLHYLSFEGMEHLHTLISAGESLPAPLAQRLARQVPLLINAYGPTECAVCATVHPVSADVREYVPIGRAIEGAQVYVLDDEQRPVAPGAEGEIYIGGRGVGRGYINEPAETGRAFISNPFLLGTRLYRTGDTALRLPDGTLHFTGRANDQLKVRGVRIDPVEVESHIRHYTGIVDCFVVATVDEGGAKHLSCYYSAKQPVQAATMREHLKRRLPSAMIPQYFVHLEELPRTAHGKIDRAALPKPRLRSAPGKAVRSPGSPVERMIAEIWKDLLGLEEVSLDDDWFALGGDSLRAMQAVARINERLGIQLDDTALLETSRLEELVGAVQCAPLAVSQTIPAAGALKEDYPLSQSQRMFWFLYQLDPRSSVNHIATAVAIAGPLDANLLERALAVVTERHEPLRSCVRMTSRGPVQHVDRSSSVRLERAEGVEQLPAGDPLLAPFALDRAPLMRARLVLHSSAHATLYLVLHHIVADGSSLSILVEELAWAYEQLQSGQALALPAVQLQYGQMAGLEAAREQHDLAELPFWTEHLAGAPRSVQLPRSGNSSNDDSLFDGCTVRRRLPEPSARLLERLCAEFDCTPYVVLLSLFNLMMHRLSGQSDVVVGTPVSTRDGPGAERTIGPFLNTLALRSRLEPELSFAEYLRRQKTTVLDCLHRHSVPFSRVVDALTPARDAGSNPLFNVMFDHLMAPAPQRRGGLTFEHEVHATQTSKFDLTLSTTQRASSFELALEYRSGLLSPTFPERFLDGFVALLNSAGTHPTRLVWALDVIGVNERRMLLTDFNSQTGPQPQLSFAELFEAQARRTPGRAAVGCDGAVLTYGEVDARASRLAAELQARGARPDTIVALLLKRSIDMVIGIVAVWKAGAAYVPLDVEHPPARILGLLQQTDPVAILSTPDHAHKSGAYAGRVVNASVSTVATSVPVQLLPPQRDLSHLAYVLFTSGSTGTPKGVMIEQWGLVNHTLIMTRHLELDERSVVAQNASHCFDVSVWQLTCALTVGGRVEIFTPERTLDLEGFLAGIDASGVTVLEVVPTFLSALLDHLDHADAGGARMRSLRKLIVTGEATLPALVRRWLTRYPHIPVTNAYGPAEASDDVSFNVVTEPPPEDATTLPIGVPLDNIRLYVLDEHLQLCPIGVSGELCVAGRAVGRGYLGDPERTRNVFMEDPFASVPNTRLYRSGDIARWRDDGVLELQGRRDAQLKVRGFRIEPGEVEHHLSRHPAIHDVAVVNVARASETASLGAYYVSDEPLSIAELRGFMAKHVPPYMVPSVFVHMKQLPRNQNGKLDRRALRAPDRASASPDAAPSGASSAAERLLLGIWMDVLKAPALTIDDNYFECGGDSLKCIEVVSRARMRGQLLTVRNIFQYQTIRLLAPHLQAAATRSERRVTEGFVPLTPVQAEHVSRYGLEPHYNQAFIFECREALDILAFAKALRALEERQEALRLRFRREESGHVVQRLGMGSSELLKLHLLDGRGEGSELERAAVAQLQRSLNLEQGPTFRAALMMPDPGRSRVAMVIHHLVVDALSWQVLMKDLVLLYAGFRSGSQPVLPPVGSSYAEWAERLRAHGASLPQEETLSPEMTDETETIRSWMRSGSDLGTGPAARSLVISKLDRAVTRALMGGLSGTRRGGAAALLLTVIAKVLSSCTGVRRVPIAVETHGRAELFPELDISRTVGWFTATALMVVSEEGSASLLERTARVQAQLDEQVERAALASLREQHESAGRTAASQASANEFQIVFNYLGVLVGEEALGPFSSGRIVREDITAAGLQWPETLDIDVFVEEGALNIEWRFASGSVSCARVCELSEALERELREAIPQEVAGAGEEAEESYPLTHAQAGMLFQTLMDEQAQLYHQQLAMRLGLSLDALALKNAWQHVVGMHAVLRSRVSWEQEVPVQIVLRTPAPSFQHVALQAELDAGARLQDFLEADLRRGFDLRAGPLVRLTLLETGPSGSFVVLSYHHVLLDGGSIPLLLRDLEAAYTALVQGQPPPTPGRAPFRHFVDWALAQDTRAAEAAWTCYLTGLPARPKRLTSRRQPHARPVTVSSELSPQQTRSLLEATRRWRTTLSHVLRTAWGLVLGFATDSQDVLFGTVVAGRPAELPGAAQMIGVLINTVPFRVRWAPNESFVNLTARTQSEWLEVREFEHTPLQKLKRLAGFSRDGDPFECLFTFASEDIVPGEDSIFGGSTTTVSATRELTHYGLSLDATVSGEQLRLKLTCPADPATEANAQALLESYEEALAALPARADAPMGTWWPAAHVSATYLPEARALDALAPESSPSSVHPAEQTILRIWQEVLGRPSLGLEDNLFESGGDSISSLRIVSRLMQQGLSTSVKQVFECQTAGALARALLQPSARAESKGSMAQLPAQVIAEVKRGYGASVERVLGLTPVQRMILKRHADGLAGTLFHDQSMFEYQGEIDIELLRDAWAHVLESNPSLRSMFVWNDEAPVQVVLARGAPQIDVRDISHLTVQERTAFIEEFRADDLRDTFDPSQAPLIRLALLRHGPDRHSMMISFHVMLMDGWCFAFVLSELHRSYAALVEGQPVPLSGRADFGDYVEWLSSQDRAEGLSYWRAELLELAGALGVPDFRRDHVKMPQAAHPIQAERTVLSEELTAKLKAWAARERVTVNTLVQTAWAELLRRQTGMQTVVFGATVSGRPPELAGADLMVGMFFNDVPVRVSFQPGEELGAVARRVQQRFSAMRRYEYFSADDLRGAAGVPPGVELFQSLLVFENYPKELEAQLRDTRKQYLVDVGSWRREVSDLDMTVYVEVEDSTSVEIRYLADVFEPDTVRARLQGYLSILQELADSDRSRLRQTA